MGLVTEKFLICDGCSETFGIDIGRNLKTAFEIRNQSKIYGWKNVGSKDYCELCKK